MSSGQVIHNFEGHQQEVNALAFSGDSRYVVTGSSDCTARLWTIGAGRMRLFRVTDAMKDLDASIASVALSPDDLLAAGCFDNVIRLWNISTGDLVGRLCGHDDAVYCVLFSKDGSCLYSGGMDRSLKCWDIANFKKSLVSARLKKVDM